MEIIEGLLSRSSYRGEYQNKLVKREDLKKIMEVGLAAPSGCNKQTTSLIAIDDRKILIDIKKILDLKVGITAPAMICVLTKKIIGYGNRYYNIQDYSAAIENMLLACVGLGYQSCWIEGYINNENNMRKQIEKLLKIPNEFELVCILPIGIAKEQILKSKKKKFEERAWFNEYMMN